MVINTNIGALNTLNKLNANSTATSEALERLSSGLKINKAADDAAGLAISQKMQAQITGLDTAADNAQNGISLVQTAEGALSEIQSILQRMNELAVEAANGTNTDQDSSKLNDEFKQLKSTIDKISNQTTFNTKSILTDSGLFASTGITLQIGAASVDTMTIGLTGGCSTASLQLTDSVTIDSAAAANSALDTIKNAIDTVSGLRAQLGAYQNALNHTINNLNTQSENLQSAKSRITDVDMAAEMTEFTKNNILTQSAEAMLAQANQLPQGVLSLLK